MNLRFVIFCSVFTTFVYTTTSSKDGSLQTIEALAGETIYLPCNVTTNESDEVVLILWYREDIGTPIYSVDVREGISKAAKRWSDHTTFGERAYFIFDKDPGKLSIQNTQNSDAGTYRCRVDYLKAQTRNVKIKLTVIEPPDHVIIRDDLNVERSTVVGPYGEGDMMSLKCEVVGGKPLPIISWYRDGLELSSETSIVPGEKYVQSEITIGPLGREDLNSRLTCRASNHPRAAPLEAVVQIDMNFPPLNIRLLGAHQPLSAGRRYDLLCQSAGSRPPAVITWWQNGIRLEKTTETTSSDGNQTTSTLSIIFSKSDAGKYLSCKAYNNAVPSDPLEDGWKLDIQYVPETYVRLGTSLDPNAIREGTDVYFDCLVVAHPGVFRVEWRHNGRSLPHNISQGVIISNQSLVLQGVSRGTAGNYSCVGYNAEGEGVSEPFGLNILYAPTCQPNQPRVYGVAKQEDAKIKCLVDANPPDVEFSWTFNNSAESIDVASNHIARSGTSSTVTYTPITELDYGTLLCVATNKIGRQKIPCVFHIIAAGRPDQVHNCTLTNISMTSLTVTCSDGFNGGLQQYFVLELKDAYTKELKANITSTFPRFTVSSLSPGNLYILSIYAFNSKGRSDLTTLSAAMLRMPEKQLTAEHAENSRAEFIFSPMISLTVGLTLAVMVAGLAVVLALRIPCNRARRRQKDLSNEHSSREGSPGLSEKSGGSKEVDSNDSDDKNPDVIPEVIDTDEQIDCMRRRQHISTIESGCSPSRGTLVNTPTPQYTSSGMTLHASHNIGYCTLRNSLKPQPTVGSFTMNVTPHIYSNSISQCTLPRNASQMWPSYSGTIAGVRPLQQINTMHHLTLQSHPPTQLSQHPEEISSASSNQIASSFGRTIPMQAVAQEPRNRMCPTNIPKKELVSLDQSCASDEEDTVQTPLMMKRESSV